MNSAIDSSRFQSAAARFRAFFSELGEAFVERTDILQQLALALLSREHVLLTGPPGTAKSRMASAVFNRILCERSGRPSVYARQITESTVQTDLVGPVDFKTLMETGRTEHFTDEGMLGAHHAFLDEIFDGRDMLLRSALNVLQERELKQGGKITKGRIECAVLTSNRYIADVLEQSRETLLAFVDRIAFVGFVPRGFANPENLERVLRREIGGAARRSLDALLTIQDLDVLQAVVDRVHVPRSACTALAQLIGQLDVDMAAAMRSDPRFAPTRYLSTRTAVRAGQVLRAACVLDRIQVGTARPLQVRREDFGALRLHLILGGPSPTEVTELLKHEVEPNERRQLSTLQTEREIFDRALRKVPTIRQETFDDPLAPPESAEDATSDPPPDAAPERPPDPERLASDAIRIRYEPSVDSADYRVVLESIRELWPVAREQSRRGETAQALLRRGTVRLHDHALTSLLAARGDQDREIAAPIIELATFAADLQDDSAAMHELSHSLRVRSLHLLEEIAHQWPLAETETFFRIEEAAALQARCLSRLDAVGKLLELRRRLLGSDAESPGIPASALKADPLFSERWVAAMDGIREEMAAQWEALFCHGVEHVMGENQDLALGEVLGGVRAQLDAMAHTATRLDELRGSPSNLVAKAVGGRVGQLIRALLRKSNDRSTLHNEIDAVQALLEGANLGDAVATGDWLAWAAEGLIGSERRPRDADGDPTAGEPNLAGYRRLRSGEQRIPLSCVLCEVALRIGRRTGAAEPAATELSDLLSSLPSKLMADLATLDIERIERAADYLERWWTAMGSRDDGASTAPIDVLEILWDEGALARFSLEAQLLADLLPAHQERAAAVRKRLVMLGESSRASAVRLLRENTARRWSNVLGV